MVSRRIRDICKSKCFDTFTTVANGKNIPENASCASNNAGTTNIAILAFFTNADINSPNPDAATIVKKHIICISQKPFINMLYVDFPSINWKTKTSKNDCIKANIACTINFERIYADN